MSDLICISFSLSFSCLSLLHSLSPYLPSNYRIVSCKQSIEPYSNVLWLLFFRELIHALTLLVHCLLAVPSVRPTGSTYQVDTKQLQKIPNNFNFNSISMGRNSGNCFDTIQNFGLDSSSNKRKREWGEVLCRYICMRSFRVANYSRANWHNRSHITRRVQRAACERGVQSQVRLRWRSAQLGCLLSELWHRARWGEASEAFNQSNFPIRTNTFGAA